MRREVSVRVYDCEQIFACCYVTYPIDEANKPIAREVQSIWYRTFSRLISFSLGYEHKIVSSYSLGIGQNPIFKGLDPTASY